ncbi:hypothetical protein [Nonomuraea sediminis]|uniref:hypothetical protein n=1 Tax=Nonomuraea sediminis TaxID=2835864 RepID=UPI001BDCD07B|nr:hypothetical protein [Nonomuraea sediminis]
MFNLNRTLAAAALSTALASGIVGLGTVTTAHASAVSSGSAMDVWNGRGGRCVFLGPAGGVKRGHYENEVHGRFRVWSGWHIHRERGCVRTRNFFW